MKPQPVYPCNLTFSLQEATKCTGAQWFCGWGMQYIWKLKAACFFITFSSFFFYCIPFYFLAGLYVFVMSLIICNEQSPDLKVIFFIPKSTFKVMKMRPKSDQKVIPKLTFRGKSRQNCFVFLITPMFYGQINLAKCMLYQCCQVNSM